MDLDDKLRLEFYKLEKEFKGSISLNPTQEDKTLVNVKKLKTGGTGKDEAVFTQSIFPEVFKKVTQECYMESMDAFSKLFEDKVFYATVMDAISREAYKDLRNRK